MRLPGREESIVILREAGCGEGVVVHCLRVAEVALRLVEGFRGQGHDVDLGLVEAGALLHDLGRCRTHGIMHGVVGGELAREMGLPEAVARIM
ncbi:MAG: HDIG domain-containing protein, partial [Candidatus Bathyarchaeota archaeon]